MTKVPLPATVKGLLEHKDSLAQEVVRMKMAVEAASGVPGSLEEQAETTVKMPTQLTDCLMEAENLAKLLAKTGLLSASLTPEKRIILRAPSRKHLQKSLAQLKRIAWACQWGCSSFKVGALLAEKPPKPLNSIVLRLAARSSVLSSHDAKLSSKMRKIRLGTLAGPGMLQVEGIPGLSRKHCSLGFNCALRSWYRHFGLCGYGKTTQKNLLVKRTKMFPKPVVPKRFLFDPLRHFSGITFPESHRKQVVRSPAAEPR